MPNLNDKVKEILKKINREALSTSDPELFKLRLLSKLERKVNRDYNLIDNLEGDNS